MLIYLNCFKVTFTTEEKIKENEITTYKIELVSSSGLTYTNIPKPRANVQKGLNIILLKGLPVNMETCHKRTHTFPWWGWNNLGDI